MNVLDDGGNELPKYRSHKEVQALKITAIDETHEHPENIFRISFEASDGIDWRPRLASKKWVEEKRAEVGGYYVVYKDGYSSFSPAKAFEEGYTRVS